MCIYTLVLGVDFGFCCKNMNFGIFCKRSAKNASDSDKLKLKWHSALHIDISDKLEGTL